MSPRTISATRVTTTARRLGDEVTRRGSEMVDVARHGARHVADIPDELRSQYEHHVEPRARKAGVGLLEVAQALLAVGVAVPRLVARALTIARSLTEHAEVAQRRGHEIAERARDFAHAVPPSKRHRRHQRLHAAGWLSLGLAGGFAAGWVAADLRDRAAQARDQEQMLRHAHLVALDDAAQSSTDDEASFPPVRDVTRPRAVAPEAGPTVMPGDGG